MSLQRFPFLQSDPSLMVIGSSRPLRTLHPVPQSQRFTCMFLNPSLPQLPLHHQLTSPARQGVSWQHSRMSQSDPCLEEMATSVAPANVGLRPHSCIIWSQGKHPSLSGPGRNSQEATQASLSGKRQFSSLPRTIGSSLLQVSQVTEARAGEAVIHFPTQKAAGG